MSSNNVGMPDTWGLPNMMVFLGACILFRDPDGDHGLGRIDSVSGEAAEKALRLSEFILRRYILMVEAREPKKI